MRLGVRLGLGPLWAYSLEPDDLERAIAWDWTEIEIKRRAKIAADFAKMQQYGSEIRPVEDPK
jgi:hypothetical protein